MTEGQADLLQFARRSLDAARAMALREHNGFAASRAYYAMFYTAQAFLLGIGLAFSSHAETIAAFGRHFAGPRKVPRRFHQRLVNALNLRLHADYEPLFQVTEARTVELFDEAAEFLEYAEKHL